MILINRYLEANFIFLRSDNTIHLVDDNLTLIRIIDRSYVYTSTYASTIFLTFSG